MIEEVKKILDKLFGMRPLDVEEVASLICQLFEPKPDKGRLLTSKEANEAVRGLSISGLIADAGAGALSKAQDAKTAAIVDKQARQEMVEEIEGKFPWIKQGVNEQPWQELKRGVK